MRKENVLMALVLPLLLASTLSIGFNPVCSEENLTMIRTSSNTSVSGRIAANTTWTLADSPYTLVDHVVVETDVFLTIEPGVTVKFTIGTNLIIDGALVAQGNSTHPITFTSNASVPQPGDWGTIRFRDTSMDEACIIDWAVIEYASAGITIYKSSPKISNSTMRYNVYAFYSESDGIARISNSAILNNTRGVEGYFRYYYYPPYNRSQISHSLILNNDDGVLLLDGDLTIRESLVSNNTYGVRLFGYGYRMIQESTISNNTYGIWSESGTLRILGSNISYNNHGVTASYATISKSIISENNGKGISPTWWYDYYYNKTYYYSGTFSISYSTIIGNKENGITSKGSSIVHFSNVYGNTPYDVYNDAPFEWTYGDVDATNNWLGTTNTTEIDEHIYDYYDDYDLKKVFYKPFLDSEVTIPPIAHDVAITNVTASPTVVERWQYVYVTVNIANEGDFDENVTVTTRYDSVQIGNWTYMYGLLPAGANTTASFYWYVENVPLGKYTISAEVNIVPGETDTADNVFVDGQVEVTGPPPEPPYASFEYSPYYPSVGELVTFDASASYAPDGYIVSYFWEFGDGTTATTTVTVVEHAYTQEGTYTVTLTVTDNDGLNATAAKTIDIGKSSSFISILVDQTTITLGESTKISGSITPECEGATVTIWHRLSGENQTWSILANVTTGPMSQYSYVWTPETVGTYEVRTSWPGDADTLPAESSIITITVLPQVLVHDIAVTWVAASPTEVAPGEIVTITVTVENQGDVTETFTVTVFYDNTAVDAQTVTALPAGATITLEFEWDTTDIAEGIYIIMAQASAVAGETDTADNTFTDGAVMVVGAPPPPTRVLSIKLSGEHDYLLMENVKVRLAALVKDAATMEPVSDVNVTIEIYDPDGALWLSDMMVEKLDGTGIYEWESEGTIRQLRLAKGVYLVHVQASCQEEPTASDILEFHVDPPAEGASEIPYYIAFTAITLVGLTGLILKRHQIANRLRQLNRRN